MKSRKNRVIRLSGRRRKARHPLCPWNAPGSEPWCRKAGACPSSLYLHVCHFDLPFCPPPSGKRSHYLHGEKPIFSSKIDLPFSVSRNQALDEHVTNPTPSLRGAKRRGNLLNIRLDTKLLRGVYPEPVEGLAMTNEAFCDFSPMCQALEPRRRLSLPARIAL